IGWQDQILVTVAHDFALLPGPANLMSFSSNSSGSQSSQIISSSSSSSFGGSGVSPQSYSTSSSGSGQMAGGGRVFQKRIMASVRLNNEGEKSVLPYVQRLDGVPAIDL